jgi:hypothetical protein
MQGRSRESVIGLEGLLSRRKTVGLSSSVVWVVLNSAERYLARPFDHSGSDHSGGPAKHLRTPLENNGTCSATEGSWKLYMKGREPEEKLLHVRGIPASSAGFETRQRSHKHLVLVSSEFRETVKFHEHLKFDPFGDKHASPYFDECCCVARRDERYDDTRALLKPIYADYDLFVTRIASNSSLQPLC